MRHKWTVFRAPGVKWHGRWQLLKWAFSPVILLCEGDKRGRRKVWPAILMGRDDAETRKMAARIANALNKERP